MYSRSVLAIVFSLFALPVPPSRVQPVSDVVRSKAPINAKVASLRKIEGRLASMILHFLEIASLLLTSMPQGYQTTRVFLCQIAKPNV
ncbi:unannotated protein [freshwater metagenome]|uniref:Unannotated protein n=1 Tax=freshwater metagenome TaxID=449393 RepID=A0A6J6B8H3_9ZZZZ